MIGDALRSIRVFHNLKQADAAAKLGISRSYLSEIESNTKEPTLQLIQRYAEIFSLPVSSIMYFAENLSNPSAHRKASGLLAGKIVAMMRFLEARAGDPDER